MEARDWVASVASWVASTPQEAMVASCVLSGSQETMVVSWVRSVRPPEAMEASGVVGWAHGPEPMEGSGAWSAACCSAELPAEDETSVDNSVTSCTSEGQTTQRLEPAGRVELAAGEES